MAEDSTKYSRNDTLKLVHADKIFFSHSIAKNPKSLDPKAFQLFRHTSDKHGLFIFLSGVCEQVTDERRFTLRPGDICFTSAFTYGYINIVEDSPYERIVIAITPNERFDALAHEVFATQNPINVNLEQYLLPFIERYKKYADALPLKEFSRLAECLIEELLHICLISQKPENYATDPSEKLLNKALEYIEENWATIQNTQEISNALFVSQSYLYDIFNRKLNIAPKAYLMRKRLQVAHAYLVSGISPSEVSQLVGFNTYTAFYRACKSFYGKTPQELGKSKNRT
ncbi:MAG: AraC family transcriptional regulator [Clostridia bacterium]|nr:AraC family transcriptional regulator [Clostridia bacterium]